MNNEKEIKYPKDWKDYMSDFEYQKNDFRGEIKYGIYYKTSNN